MLTSTFGMSCILISWCQEHLNVWKQWKNNAVNYYPHRKGETHFTLGVPKNHELPFLMLCKINSHSLSIHFNSQIEDTTITLFYQKFHVNKRGDKINKNIGQTKSHNTVWVLLAHWEEETGPAAIPVQQLSNQECSMTMLTNQGGTFTAICKSASLTSFFSLSRIGMT